MATFQTSDKNVLYNSVLHKIFIQSLKRGHLPLFDWKYLKIGTLSAKDLRKNVPIFLEGGPTIGPPTTLVIRVVLHHK